MAEIGIQLYTLRDVDAPLPAIVEAVAAAGFEGVEFAYRLADADHGAVADALGETGLEAAGAHVRMGWLEEDLEGTLETYRSLGCETIVLAILEESHFESAAAVDRTADRLSELGEKLHDRGFDFHYHNHRHEFVGVGGEPAYVRLIEHTDPVVGFELDVGLALGGGADPASLIERYGDRMPLLHMKDFSRSAGASTDLGEGEVDLEACAAAAKAHGAEWFLYESGSPDDPLASMRHAAGVLDGLA